MARASSGPCVRAALLLLCCSLLFVGAAGAQSADPTAGRAAARLDELVARADAAADLAGAGAAEEAEAEAASAGAQEAEEEEGALAFGAEARAIAASGEAHRAMVGTGLARHADSLRKADTWKAKALRTLKEASTSPRRSSRIPVSNLGKLSDAAPGYGGESGKGGKLAGVSPRPKVDWYVGCPAGRPKLKKQGSTDSDHAVSVLGGSPTLSVPFRYATYFCDILPEDLYTDLEKNWPPDTVMDNFAAKSKTCKNTGCRFYVSALEKLRGGPTPRQMKNWDKWSKAKEAWQRLKDLVFGKEFERALFAKLQVRRPIKRREIRIFTDRSGFANGRVHTDRDAKKVATMQLYFPATKDIQYDYGTCLHTTSQYKAGKPIAGNAKEKESACAVKFKFMRNSGYSFRPGAASWHSAPNGNIKHWKEHHRYTILLNWY